MRHFALLYILFTSALVAGAANAQTADSRLETVTVDAPKLDLREVIREYVDGLAAPSPFLGKIARWKAGVCPIVLGLNPDGATLVANRIKEVAKTVGASVASAVPCKTNVEIVVTPQPQALLDALRTKKPGLFGFSSGPSQTARIATMNLPIQAWYVTETEDYAGFLHPDEMVDDCAMYTGRRQDCFDLVSGFRLNDGLKSVFVNAIVVVDSGKVASLPIASVADYAAMVALAQTQPLEGCRPLPTVTNLVAAECQPSNKTALLTDTDMAYLRALYRVEPGTTLSIQKNEISHDMQKDLSGSRKP